MKRALFLSVFLFGWLLLFEACDRPCSDPVICHKLSHIEVKAYDHSDGDRLSNNDPVLASNLVLEIFPEGDDTQRICMLDTFKGGFLSATTCGQSFRIAPSIDEIVISSSLDYSTKFKAGDDLSSLMGYYWGSVPDDPRAGGISDLNPMLEYHLIQNEVLPGHLYTDRSWTSYIRFKENVEIPKGQQVFTISFKLDDNTVLSASTIPINIQ